MFRRTSPLGTLFLAARLGPRGADAHGYLKAPRSRNYVASLDPKWFGGTATDPAPENCPHCLNIGGTEAQCGKVGDHNYDYPESATGSALASVVQECYGEGAVIDVESVLTAHHKGHFELKACPVASGEVPTQSCFDAHELTFVQDMIYGAHPDPLYPERAYIPLAENTLKNPDGSYRYHHRYKLPDGLRGDLVLLQWYYVTANSCHVEGYGTYDFPPGFNPTIHECPYVAPDGRGLPEQFWNCAEVRVTNNCGTAPSPSPPTTPPPTTGVPALPQPVTPTPPAPAPNPNCAAIANQCSATLPCAYGGCCSQWGYCGTTPAYCGDCCQGANCWGGQPPAPLPTTPGPVAPPVPPPSTPPTPPTPTTGFNYSAEHGEDSRLIAYVGNWQGCPTDKQVDAYSHMVIAFAVSYTWNPAKNNCDSQCHLASTVPICGNQNRQDLVDGWRAKGKKVILSFGGAGMGGSWSSDNNNCWDFCFGKEDRLSSDLTTIIANQNFDGIDIDYEYCYDVAGKQSGKCPQRTSLYSDAKAQTFLDALTSGLRVKLDALQMINGYDRGRYEITHAPMDSDLVPSNGFDSQYFRILKDRRADLDFLMPQFYNGVTRPGVDGVDGSDTGEMSAAVLFSSLANDLFEQEPHKVVFGFCISDCSGTGSNIVSHAAVQIMSDLKAHNNNEFSCNGGAFFWVATHDSSGLWSDGVVQEVSLTAGCSVGGTPSPPTPLPQPVPTKSPTKSPTKEPVANTSYYVVCGKGSGCWEGNVLVANEAEGHEVRCCSDTSIRGWKQRNGCDVWSRSAFEGGKCYRDKSYGEAQNICTDAGGRICTRSELERQCTRGSGCSFDSQLNWSSTEVSLDTPPPAAAPNPVPVPAPAPAPNPNCPAHSNACSATNLCPNSGCCSQWGYCGTTSAHCGDCCQSGNCLGSPPTPPVSPPSKSPTKSHSPTKGSTKSPTNTPTKTPTKNSTHSPTKGSTKSPTNTPTKTPTKNSTHSPTKGSTKSPTNTPTTTPTKSPTGTTRRPTSGVNTVLEVLGAHSTIINSKLLLYKTPQNQWEESSVYRYGDMFAGLRVASEIGIAGKHFYMGDDSECGYLYGVVNLAAFLAQSMKETIQYDACDENSWDLVGGKYPLSNSCGQLGQSYQDYHCAPEEAHMECPVKADMELTATTHAKWYGAPGPLFCGPKSKYPFTGYWDYSYECDRPWAGLACDAYEGQQAGRMDNSAPVANTAGRTDVEGCCFWGRGVIQTTGVCNFGKLNYFLGARAAQEGRESRYPDVDFCERPDTICASEQHKELKWIAGYFYWMESLQSYSSDGWDYITALHNFVDGGMTGHDFIDAVSGIVNRGCHNPPCATGDVDGKPERRDNFSKVLRELEVDSGCGGGGAPAPNPNPPTPSPPTPTPTPPTGTIPAPSPPAPVPAPNPNCPAYSNACSATNLCPNGGCCSQWGHCGTTPAYCGECCQSGNCLGNPPTPPVSPPPPPPPPPAPAPNPNCPAHSNACSATNPCAYGCCSQWGYCGTSAGHCGDCCQSGNCWA